MSRRVSPEDACFSEPGSISSGCPPAPSPGHPIQSVESGSFSSSLSDYTAGKKVSSSSTCTPAICRVVCFDSAWRWSVTCCPEAAIFTGRCLTDDLKLFAQATIQGTIQSTRADGTPSSDNKHTALGPFVSSRLLELLITCTWLEHISQVPTTGH
jgi:hypothetical protein